MSFQLSWSFDYRYKWVCGTITVYTLQRKMHNLNIVILCDNKEQQAETWGWINLILNLSHLDEITEKSDIPILYKEKEIKRN